MAVRIVTDSTLTTALVRTNWKCSVRTGWTTPGTTRGYTPQVSHPRTAVCALGIALSRVTRTGLRRPCAVRSRFHRTRYFRFPRRTPLRNPTKVNKVLPPWRSRNGGAGSRPPRSPQGHFPYFLVIPRCRPGFCGLRARPKRDSSVERKTFPPSGRPVAVIRRISVAVSSGSLRR
jgi:hypothetical protein